MHLFLIGARGSGKSTVGPILASRLSVPFADVDECIESESSMSIAEIFTVEGEAAFRDREATMLKRLVSRSPSVISTGGGVVVRPENLDMLRTGFVVWLQGSPEHLWQRIEADVANRRRRPNLTATGGLEEVRTVLARREPLYRSAADFIVDATASPESIADAILQSPAARAAFTSQE